MDLLSLNEDEGDGAPSLYAASAPRPAPRPALGGDAQADLCIIGAGFTGLSAALHAARRGAKVIVLEARHAGFGASGRNGGQIGSGLRAGQEQLEATYGPEVAMRLWRMSCDAIHLTRELAARHAPDAEQGGGVAMMATSARSRDAACRAAEHLARHYGHEQIECLSRDAARELLGTDAAHGAVLDHMAGHLHPLRFARGLAAGAEAAGAVLHEGTRALKVRPGPRPAVETAQGTVQARMVIVAANGYLGDLVPEAARRVMPIVSYMGATPPLGARLPLARPIAVHDDRFVVNYWRANPQGRLIFGGGESYGYRHVRDIGAKLRAPLARLYPELRDVPFTHVWGGTLAITRSRLPLILRPAQGVLHAGGYSGHGVALSVLAGRILAREADAPDPDFELLSRLGAKPFPGGPTLRQPLLALAMGWHALRDRVGV
ncbi:NAD(P)/FAD-dependent oxidoreductase [Profundibacterium mesophilum]|uniref:Oxidoreductase n=1 Tax=Profundibacterium mesophilum KAUST100406-0324 TaxID=1037889 RepID=A0A921NUP1_9RHOB|nr:FAD-binding oxidoreductase [Profundibacterium mesophilum]KAF0676999.1 Oxidoreductase [Profundibacterium mesophilum KAUST100406-0324]